MQLDTAKQLAEFTAEMIELHYGPGPHPDGSPQEVHGGGGATPGGAAPAAWRPQRPQPLTWDGDASYLETPTMALGDDHNWRGRITGQNTRPKQWAASYEVDHGRPRGHSFHNSIKTAKDHLRSVYEHYAKTGMID